MKEGKKNGKARVCALPLSVGKAKNNFFTWRLEWDFSFIIIKGGEGEFFFTEKGRVGRGMMRFTAT